MVWFGGESFTVVWFGVNCCGLFWCGVGSIGRCGLWCGLILWFGCLPTRESYLCDRHHEREDDGVYPVVPEVVWHYLEWE